MAHGAYLVRSVESNFPGACQVEPLIIFSDDLKICVVRERYCFLCGQIVDIALNRLVAAASSALAPTEHPNPIIKASATADMVVVEICAYFPAELVI